MNRNIGPIAARVEGAVIDSLREAGASARAGPLVVAVSGGADSLCLLYALHRACTAHGCRLHVAHLDHTLRGDESDADARFVAKQAAALGLECTVESRDVAAYQADSRCSLEEAAREVRYRFLRDVALRIGAQFVLTGHTRNDAAETVMLHIIRGCGVRGLRGLELISACPGDASSIGDAPGLRLIRPLLAIWRSDAVDYCRALALEPREDLSNQSRVYLRNRIRLELLPAMRLMNARVEDALLRLAAAAIEDDDALEEETGRLWDVCATVTADRVDLGLGQFISAPPAVQARLIFRAVHCLAGSTRDITSAHIAAVRGIAAGVTGRQLDLPSGIVWRHDADQLTAFFRGAAPRHKPLPDSPVSLTVPGEVAIPEGKLTARLLPITEYAETGPDIAFLDADVVGPDLFVRRRRAGDRFRPLGLGGEKKLQDFMVDAHIPAVARDSVPIVCNRRHILWVAGFRLDDRVRVTQHSRTLLRLACVRGS